MDKEKLAKAITKAIGYAENGGEPKEIKAGKTGEMKSIFQYTPDTWKLYSKQVFGEDNVPLTPDSESYVTHQKVSKWLDAGYSPEQIASMWNAGEQRPDAYKENWKGINKKYGVSYDTPAYAKKVADYTKQFMEETPDQAPTQSQPQQNDVVSKLTELTKKVSDRMSQGMVPQQSQQNGLLGNLAIQR